MRLRWLFAAAGISLAALWAFSHFRHQQQLAAERLQEWALAEELDERPSSRTVCKLVRPWTINKSK